MKMIKEIFKWICIIGTSFWSSSMSIMWGFVAMLVLMSYKPELISVAPLLAEVRLFLLNNWKLFWLAFFGLNLIEQIKEKKEQ